MKTKMYKMFAVLSIIVITMMMWTSAQAQTAHFCLDTLQGNKIKYCLSDYPDGVWLYKKAAAQTNIEWQMQNPTPNSVYADSILVTSINTGPMSFFSIETGWISFSFYLVNGPVNSNLPDITTCGNLFSYVVNSGNSGIDATWLWNSGTITRRDTITTEGIKWVVIDNGCGPIVTDTFEVTSNHTNDANLGVDQTLCLGNTATLTTGNTNIVSYLWSDNSTGSTLQAGQTGIYSVTTTDNNACVSADTVSITVSSPPLQEIELVTMDTTNGNNRITWDETLHADGSFMKIYRELTTNTYQLVSTAPYSSGTWTDTVNSRNQPWRYKIAVVDTCSNTGAQSSYVQSIHTWVSTDGIGGYTVQWTDYSVESKSNVVSQYNIYAGPNFGGLYYLTFVSGTVTVYSMPAFLDSFVVVGAELIAKSTYQDALSNWIVATDVVGIKEDPIQENFLLYPNPATNILNIQTEGNVVVDIISLSGEYMINTTQKSIHIESLASGTYIVRLQTNSGYHYQKFVKR